MSKHSRGAGSSHHRPNKALRQAHARLQPSDDRSVHWSADATWKCLMHDLKGFPNGLKVLELCGGIGTAHIALQELLKNVATFSLVDHFDIDEALRPLLIASGLSPENIHLGRKEGDILKRSPQNFPQHHLLVAGPPCPPWSSVGSRSSWADARSKPFNKVLDVIAYHARHGALLLFVLENVVGVLSSTKDRQKKPIDIIVKRLRNACPGWSIEIHRVNSLHFGVPQSRPRVYIVGRKYSPENNGSQMPPLRTFRERVPLGRCLEKEDIIPGTYTMLQRRNIKDWKALYKLELAETKFSNQFAVVDASRTPTRRTSWCNAGKHPDRCPCLTASGPLLHVIELGPSGSSKSIDRPLRNIERARIQGFSGAVAEAAAHMPVAHANRIFGNAMTLPVVGAVLAHELVGLSRAINRPTLSALFDGERDEAQYYKSGYPHRANAAPQGRSEARSPSVALSSPPSLPLSSKDVWASKHGIIGTDVTSAKRRCL